MGFLTGLVTWPLAPVRGVVALARLVGEEAERQHRDPVAVRRALDQVEQDGTRG